MFDGWFFVILMCDKYNNIFSHQKTNYESLHGKRMKTLFFFRGLSFLTIFHTATIAIRTVAVFPFETGSSIKNARYSISFKNFKTLLRDYLDMPNILAFTAVYYIVTFSNTVKNFLFVLL
jgi:hypothetical protein